MGHWVFSPSYQAAVRVLVAARKTAGLTQRELAKRIGRTYSVITNVERGERQVDVVDFIAIARALGIDDAALIRRVAEAIGVTLQL